VSLFEDLGFSPEERYHLASDDYEELWDAILEHPSPEKAVDGDPYLRHRPRYRRRTASADTDLSASTTGDSGQRHTDLNATPGPMPQVDFIPFEEGTRCSFCNERPAECTVNGANLCLEDAQDRWGVDIAQAMKANGVEDMLTSGHDTPLDEQLAEEDGPDFSEPHTAMSQYQGDHTFVFHQANPRSMGGVTHHVLEAWDDDVPEAHVRPEERSRQSPGNYAKPAGSISWMHGNGTIADIKVDQKAQRQGLATELLRRARDIAANTRGVRPPKHSPNRTNEGDQWAKSLDERLPRRIQGDLHEGRWRDVMDKAKRMRADKAVRLLETPTPDSPYVFAEVQGDTALHHCFVAVKGDEQGQWSCSCNWGDFGPNGPLAEERSSGSPYKKTPCSHVLATRWELQSRSMFGRNPYTGALKEGSMDVLDDWFAGRFMVEARGPSQYTPIHPGYDPKSSIVNPRATHFEDFSQPNKDEVSERTGTAINEAPHTSHNGPEGDIEHSGPLTHEMMVHHIMDMHDLAHTMPGVVEKGRKWYKKAHDQAKTWSKQYGLTHRQGAGVMAALSPGKHWDTNLSMAHYYMKHLSQKTNEDGTKGYHTFDMSPEHVESLSRVRPKATKDNPDPRSAYEEVTQEMAKHGLTHGQSFHKDSMTPEQAHWALKLQAKHTHNVRNELGGDMVEKPHTEPTWQSEKEGVKAVKIARGEADPDEVLGGHKVRSFFNNILAPGKTDDVTVDSHAASIAAHGKMSSSSKALKQMLEGPVRSGLNSKMGYAHVASAYREAHRRLQARGEGQGPKMDAKSTPADLQAITWGAWRDLNEGGSYGGEKPKGGMTAAGYPVYGYLYMTSASDDDNNDDNGDDEDEADGLIDPFGGPDELDPDLHRTREIHDDPDDLDTWGNPPEDDDEDDGTPYPDAAELEDLPYERHKEGAMYDWSQMLRQARREVLAAQVPVPPPTPAVPVQYLGQVPHHLASGMDEFGFDPHQAIAVPSEQWQAQHSPGAHNPASTAPPGFGEALDPLDQRDMLGSPYPDEKLLEPGPVITSPIRSPGFSSGYEVFMGHRVQAEGGGGGSSFVPSPQTTYVQAPLNPEPPYPMVQAPSTQPLTGLVAPEEPAGGSQALASYQEGLEWLRPPGGASTGPGGASPGMSREALVAAHQHESAELASAADAFLRTGSIPVPGMEVNMDTILSLPQGPLSGMGHDARSRDFTPAEQDEMVREGELEGARASNLHMLRLQGSMYEELERQLAGEDQSQAAANALFW
jgi:GNAT superfamily N-acetyltransferase